jgi:hypothetical protein
MYYAGQLVKEWRGLNRTLKKQQQESMMALPHEAPVSELEWRIGLLNQNGFEAGIAAQDFQAIAKKLMMMYHAQASASTSASASAENKSAEPPSAAPIGGAVSPAENKSNTADLGRIVKVQEWHLEDVSYMNGLRARQSSLVSTLPAVTSSTNTAAAAAAAPSTISEVIQKQRISWMDFRVLQRRYDLRASLKCERPVPSNSINGGIATQRRMQTRRSFWIENYLRIDLSMVQQQNLLIHNPTNNNNNINNISTPNSSSRPAPSVRYEIEMELLPEGAATLSDSQLVQHMWNWLLEFQDLFGKMNASETIDGHLLVLRIPNEPTHHTLAKSNITPNTSSTTAGQTAIASDVLLVPTTRDICRPK